MPNSLTWRNRRGPDYRSLSPPQDTDSDGIPDYWERQFNLDPIDATDAARLTRGYSQVEHYFNNTNPMDSNSPAYQPIIYVAAAVSRATPNRPGEWRVTRSVEDSSSLTVRYVVRGDAESGRDYAPLTGRVKMPPGARSVAIPLTALTDGRNDRTVVVSLITEQDGCLIGCPAESLVVIQRPDH